MKIRIGELLLKDDEDVPLWVPLAGPQTEGYNSPADELFYGGSAGGGKTQLLIGLALTAHHRSIIFRREFPQLRGILDECEVLLTGRGRFNGQSNLWRLNDGRRLEFGAVQYEADVSKYQGRPHDLLCVVAGTSVWMADNSYRPIERVQVGDYVLTLEGARRVTRALSMGIKECVEVEISCQGKRFSQVQSREHSILTECGWVSHDTICASHPSLICEPISHHDAHRSVGLSSLLCEARPQDPSVSRSNRAHTEGWYRYPWGYQSWSDSFSDRAGTGQGTGFSGWNAKAQEVLRLALSRPGSLGHRQPLLLLAQGGTGPWAIVRATDCVRAWSLLSDSRGCCSSCIDPHGEQSRLAQVHALVCPRPRGYAGAQTPRHSGNDAQDGTPIHSLDRGVYAHPYTQERRRIPADVMIGSLSFTPAGKHLVFDLTVDDANHYITGAGFINKNCFDEIPQFSERQYRFLIGWNRTTLKKQRCRVVCAGNPPTSSEGEWVQRYWGPWLDAHHPNPAKPGELRWYATVEGKDEERPDSSPFEYKGDMIQPRSRTFIPARLSDNPHLIETGYMAVLQAMPEPLRSQMLYGDFTIGTTDDPWQIIPTEWVRLAQKRWTPDGCPKDKNGMPLPQDALGVDVARGGKDQTILSRRFGTWFASLEKHAGTATPDGPTVAGLVLAALTAGGYANIDGIGVGASVYDQCVQQGVEVNSVIFSAGTSERDKSGKLGFANLRAFAYWSFREALDPVTGDNLALPPDPELLADLCAPKWKMGLRGIIVESKEDIKVRIGRSPDCGDAVVLAAMPGPALPFSWMKG